MTNGDTLQSSDSPRRLSIVDVTDVISVSVRSIFYERFTFRYRPRTVLTSETHRSTRAPAHACERRIIIIKLSPVLCVRV